MQNNSAKALSFEKINPFNMEKEKGQKKPYSKPKIIEYGAIEAITEQPSVPG
jgi:hypothetical protein